MQVLRPSSRLTKLEPLEVGPRNLLSELSRGVSPVLPARRQSTGAGAEDGNLTGRQEGKGQGSAGGKPVGTFEACS